MYTARSDIENGDAPIRNSSGSPDDLEAAENDKEDRPPFCLTKTELKLLGISGVGFFLDAYDLFIINQVTVLLQDVLYKGDALPNGLHGLINASANIGSVMGQFLFGYLADALGRRAVYGKELIIIILATIVSISAPTGPFIRGGNPDGVLIWLIVCRIILGIGVGGDYPMSASVSSERTSVRKRGSMLAYVFANQGWGSLVGSLVTMITLLLYRHVMNDEGKISRADGVWRIIVGFSLIPAFGTLYHRLKLPEAKRFVNARQRPANKLDIQSGSDLSIVDLGKEVKQVPSNGKGQFTEFLNYFSEWRHARILIGTCMCWFLVDVAFYGINLNQSVVLQEIGFGGKTGTAWHKLYETALGNLIITALGFVPGYYVTVLTIEYLGRKWIQIQGFLGAALFLTILAAKFHNLSTPAFVVCFAFLQFFFNFGANATTFIYPAEVFPTRFRATAHGMSAACGKAGAIVSSLVFNQLSHQIGTPKVLWIFVACCVAGAAMTLLLPEVKGRDPDIVDADELLEAQAKRRL